MEDRSTLARAHRGPVVAGAVGGAGTGTGYLASVAAFALALIALDLGREPASSTGLLRLAVLAVLGLGYGIYASHTERLSRDVTDQDPVGLHGAVWAFAGVLTLPAGWTALLVVLLWTQAAWHRRAHRNGSIRPLILSASATVLGGHAAGAVLRLYPANALDGGMRGALTIGAAALVFAAVAAVVAAPAVWVFGQPDAQHGPFARSSYGYEAAGLILAIVTAALLVNTPVLAPLVVGLAAVLHRAAFVKELHQAAATDAKTGLLNARAWTARARNLIRRAALNGRPVAVLVLDLDHFKAVNDAYGHLVGDAVLTSVARCLRSELREEDGIGRFGGEEFVVAMTGLDAPAARAVADRVRDAVAALRWQSAPGLTVTTSIGLAHTSRPAAATLERLLGRADEALYAAKSSGRNQVCTARP